MALLYYRLVKAGVRTLDSVPTRDGIRDQVQAMIDAEGGGGNV
ncbi:CD1375 family protein [Paenibacillus filicis]